MKAYFRPLILTAVLAAVAFSLPAGAANTAANANPKVIRACVNETNGSIRIIGPWRHGAQGPTGADGAAGARGPQGDTGPAGANLAGQILFSTGLNNLAGPSGALRYVGIADSEAAEIDQQIVAASGHFTALYCYAANVPTVSTTFTLRDNASDTSVTCTIAAGAHTGSTTGLSVPFSAGDLLDVSTPANGNGGKASFAVTVGP